MRELFAWLLRNWYSALLLFGVIYAVWYEYRHKDKLYQEAPEADD